MAPLPIDRRRVAELFARASEMPSHQRRTLLDDECAAAPVLRAEVESLLAAEGPARGFLEDFDRDRAGELLRADEAAAVPERVGPYRLLREIGRGGMGAVYLAERADGQFEQRVALKVIKRGMDSEAILHRFLRERQVLARLHHPHVARFYDGGLGEDGRPWFAMEYVEGADITRYCDERRLGVEARLRLFHDVCRAVQHAHANLVVHRDLKPSNVLVTGEGDVKLLDFGIARLLGADGDPGERTLTAAGAPVMTPEYAAPEQLAGEPVTTATDVYSLGVVLYELLTGHRLRRSDRRSGGPVRALREAEPERPSSVVGRTDEPGPRSGTSEKTTPEAVARRRGTTPERLGRRLRGDLDTVTLKALHSEPERRYPSAEALLEDVERHLAGLPVSARRDTLAYRASKFVRRHAVGVLAAAAFVALLGGFAVTATVQRALTAAERDKAEAVKDFVLSLFEASNPLIEAKGDAITARELLERGVARIDAELAGQPTIQAELLGVVGTAFKELGLYERAEPLLERALALRRQELGEEHPEVAASSSHLAALYYAQGDYGGAEALHRQALAIGRKLYRGDDPAVAGFLDDLSVVLRAQRDLEEAGALAREALAMRRRLLGGSHPDVAKSLVNVAVPLYLRGEYDAAEPLYREALGMRRRLLGDHHPEVAATMNRLALLLRRKGESEAAERLYRQALAAYRRSLGEEHPDVAATLGNLAQVLMDQADYEAAEPLYRQAISMQRQLLGGSHRDLAISLNNLAVLLSEKGDDDGAEAFYRQALAMQREALGEEHWDVALALYNLASILRWKGPSEEADALSRQALDHYRRRLPAGHPQLARALAVRGHLLLNQGRPAEAEPLLRQALTIREQAAPEDDWRRAEAQSLLGSCLSALGELPAAEPLLLSGYDGLRASRDRRREAHRALEQNLEFLVVHYERRDLPRRAALYRARLRAEHRGADTAPPATQ
ncbi:MAG TPA: serine/threonine-protein kinase [Thermoanaerobaculia bacterium]|nr:serine/threonine-protein kinase [Thermoanaerobaculia bacterium]